MEFMIDEVNADDLRFKKIHAQDSFNPKRQLCFVEYAGPYVLSTYTEHSRRQGMSEVYIGKLQILTYGT